MEAPERIWLNTYWSAASRRTHDSDVEYVRADLAVPPEELVERIKNILTETPVLAIPDKNDWKKVYPSAVLPTIASKMTWILRDILATKEKPECGGKRTKTNDLARKSNI